MADDDGPNNLIHFPRVGYTEPTEPPPETPAPAPADVPFAAPADVSDNAPEAFAPATRPSPLDTLTALADPGLGAPFAGDSEPDPAPASPGAMVPATFRSEAAQPVAPRLGALSLAAILAVSVAAMRGIHTAISGRRESREQREAVAKTASTAKDSPSGGGSKKQLQPSHEWGRKSLQRGPGGPAGRSGGSGPGRSGRGGSGPHSGSGGGRRKAPTTKSPSSSGGGSGGGRGGRGGGSGSGGKGFGINSPRRNSQGGGVNLRKNSRGPGSSGSGGSGGSGGSKGPGSGGGGKNRGPGGSGSGSSGGGSSTNRKRGPGSTGSGGSAGGGGGRKRGPGSSGSGTGKGPGSKSPGKGSGTGAGTGAAGSKGIGTGKGTGPKSGAKKSPRGTTGPSGILRKKPGTTTSGTGPKTKSKGPGKPGPGSSGPAPTGKGGKKGKAKSGKGGGTGPVGSLPKAPGGKSRKGKKVTLTPGIAHGTFAAMDKYGCRCGKCRRFKREYNRKVIGAMKSAARGRTTLGEAIHETAEKRLKRRRKRISPVMTKVKVKKPKKKTGPKTKAGSTKPAGPAAPAGPALKAPAKGGSWNTAKARARKRARMRTRPVTVAGPTPAPVGGTPPKPTAPTPPPGTAPATAPAAVAGGTAAPGAGTGTVPGTGEPRLSPFEALGMATAVSAPAGPITVERADSPRPAPAKPSAGLPVGTSTKENSVSDAWLAKYGDAAVAEMSSEHQTEVTLDDTLDVLEELTQQSFAAHETCKKLAAKARQIRYDLDELAADLRSRHNVIGRLTGAAMAKLAESMEVLARKADEMSTKSLAAAELSETVENAMFDAYRPVQQATEDAGLLVPSARVHNEG
ncbi:hypothetical protein [Streptomyces puniciscabiei]|uniref:hypothetical protein n=1 Tax=Streptomyces puniciscabiei TaxID=164348 RepID=UPI0033183EE6